MSVFRITACLLISSALVSLSVKASFAADDTVTYICVEQKSLGWEPTDSGKERCCEFKPREKRFFIKFHPGNNEFDKGELKLSQIEEVNDDGSMLYQSDACDRFAVSIAQEEDHIRRRSKLISCLSLDEGDVFVRKSLYEVGGMLWRFHTPLISRPRQVDYTYSQNSIREQAYLIRGQCVLAE